MKKLLLILFIPFLCFSSQNFTQAKIHMVKLYQSNAAQKEFYCGCDIAWQGKKGVVDLSSCGYAVRKNRNRAERIEWEHVMPAYAFGSQLQCWQEGRRKHCGKIEEFNIMEGDMHNLQPAIGEVNNDRANFGYSQFTKLFTQYGQCQVAVDFKAKQFQPREQIRGIIARTYLYMSNQYNIKLSKQERQLMAAWNKMYPPNNWECKRNQLIKDVQGNDNPFITHECQ